MGKIIRICLVLIITLSVQTMCKDFFGGKPKQQSRGYKEECNKKSFIEIVRESNGCYSFNNCLYYEVNPNLSGYGCARCEAGYEVAYPDQFSGGLCYRSNLIANCAWRVVSDDANNIGQNICAVCERGYVVSSDFKKCTKLQNNSQRVMNCDNYVTNTNGKINCKNCLSGYTLSQDGKKCTKGCSVQNCDSCAIVTGRTICNDCNKGTVAIYDGINFPDGFTACLTCRTWQCLLLTEDAQKYCLKEKKQYHN